MQFRRHQNILTGQDARIYVQHVVIVQIMTAGILRYFAIIFNRTINVRKWSLCRDGGQAVKNRGNKGQRFLCWTDV